MRYTSKLLLILLLSSCVRPPVQGTPANEQQYYKLMYEQAVVATTNATTLTQWVIGIVVAMVTLLFAGQFLFNLQLNTAKLNEAKAELRNEINDLKNNLEAKNSLLDNQLKRAKGDIKKDIVTLTGPYSYSVSINIGELMTQRRYLAALRLSIEIIEIQVRNEAITMDMCWRVQEALARVGQINKKDVDKIQSILPDIYGKQAQAGDSVADLLKKVEVIDDSQPLY